MPLNAHTAKCTVSTWNPGAKCTWYESTWNPGTCAYQTSADHNHKYRALNVVMAVLFVVNSIKLHLTTYNLGS